MLQLLLLVLFLKYLVFHYFNELLPSFPKGIAKIHPFSFSQKKIAIFLVFSLKNESIPLFNTRQNTVPHHKFSIYHCVKNCRTKRIQWRPTASGGDFWLGRGRSIKCDEIRKISLSEIPPSFYIKEVSWRVTHPLYDTFESKHPLIDQFEHCQKRMLHHRDSRR